MKRIVLGGLAALGLLAVAAPALADVQWQVFERRREQCFNTLNAFAPEESIRGCSDLIIEVNPRHTAFYGHSLGFRDRGDTRLCPRVNAPAKLMHLECDMAARLIRMCAGNPIHRSERFSFYRHFLTGAEGTVALNNLRRLASHGFSPQDCVTGCPAPSHPTPAVAAVAGS